ncbi:Dipeptidyl peptidase 2 [Balamuthia mandrillaris]
MTMTWPRSQHGSSNGNAPHHGITVNRRSVQLLVFCCLVVLVHCTAASSNPPSYKENWFMQTTDHFNSQITPPQYQQRYLTIASSSFCQQQPPQPPSAPSSVLSYSFSSQGSSSQQQSCPSSSSPPSYIFFYTGNEGDITGFWENTGFVFELAETAPFKGKTLVVFAEHRFYGKSLPYGPKLSFQTPYIGLLSIEQALADYALLVSHLKAVYSAPNAKVVAFGGSYGGMLSAYFRMKYPHIVDAALAASAPVLIVSGSETDYYETVTNDFAAADSRCPDIVRKGFSEVLRLAAQGPKGLAELSKEFSLCKPLRDQHDVEHLILWAENGYGTLAMMDYPYPTNFLAPLPAWPVKAACNTLLRYQDQPLKALALSAGLFFNGTTSSVPCFDIYEEFVECADQTGCGTGPAGLSWDYQVCTEVIYLPSTNNVTDMFVPRQWTLEKQSQYCQKKWGVEPRPGWLDIQYGGGNLNGSSNIIFSNGLLDPWHTGGILHSLSDTLVAIVIKDGAHHLDLRGSNPADPASVTEARRQEAALLTKWLA